MGGEYKTEQEAFWAGDFGDDYLARNRSDQLRASKLAMFTRMLKAMPRVGSAIELGANIGLNLHALHTLLPKAKLTGLEINARAHAQMKEQPFVDARHGSILDTNLEEGAWDLAFTFGVLIHIAPDALPSAYDALHRASRRYLLVAEYYNPAPVEVPYRGHQGKLFKRDFAGDLLERHKGLRLVDYGFQYRRDPVFPADDLTWFVLEKS